MDHRIRRIAPDGTVATVAGSGIAGDSGDGGAATDAQLHEPYGLAFDRAGNLYFADLGNRRVRKISGAGTITTVAGGGTLPAGGENEGSPAVAVALNAPRDLAIAEDGSLLVSDFGANRIYRVSPAGILTTLADKGLLGPAGLLALPDGTVLFADSGNRRIGRVLRGVVSTFFQGAPGYPLYTPTGLARDTGGNIYIADGRAEQMLHLSPLGSPLPPAAAGGRVVAVDGRGNIYCAMAGLVRRIATNGSVSIVAGQGKYGFGGDGGAADLARLNRPLAVAVDPAGNLYIADSANHRIRRVSPAGVIDTVAGTGEAGFGGDGGGGGTAKLNAPQGVACDGLGNVFIADTGNHRVRKLAASGQISTVAGAGLKGYSGDGGPAWNARLDSPAAVAVDPAGVLYVADSGNRRVRKIDSVGVIQTVGTAMVQFEEPTGLAVDRDGNVFVADAGGGWVRKINPAGAIQIVNSVALAEPRGVALDGSGGVLAAETGRHRIVRLNPEGKPEALAGNGTAGYSGDGGTAGEAQLSSPAGLAAGANGVVLVADTANNRIRKLTPMLAGDLSENPPFAVVNAASYREGPVAPGELVTILGDFIGEDVDVAVNEAPVRILYAGRGQINLQIPYSAGSQSAVRVTLSRGGKSLYARTLAVATAAPGLFTLQGNSGQAVALLEDGTANSLVNPAPRGSLLTLYATGEGLLSADKPLSVAVADSAAEVVGAQNSPAAPGVLTLTVRVPGGWTPSGVQPVMFRAGAWSSQGGVTVVIR